MKNTRTKILLTIIIAILAILGLKASNVQAVGFYETGCYCTFAGQNMPSLSSKTNYRISTAKGAEWGKDPGMNYNNANFKGWDPNPDNDTIKRMAYLGYKYGAEGCKGSGENSRNEGSKNTFQRWLWAYVYPGFGSYGGKTYIEKDDVQGYQREAITWLAENSGGGDISISGNTYVENYQTAEFTMARNKCEITNIDIHFTDGTIANSSEAKLSKTIAQLNAEDNPKFYIVNNTDKELDYVYFTYKCSTKSYWITYEYWKESSYDCQPMIKITDHGEETIGGGENGIGHYSLDLKVKKGPLTVKKESSLTERVPSQLQVKVKFEKNNKWIKSATDSKVEFTSNFSEAQVFNSGSSAQIVINGLYAGSNYKYTVVEIDASTYFNDPIKMIGGSGGTVGKVTEGGVSYYAITGIELNTTAVATMKDEPTSGDLVIKKVDKNTGQALQGVKFAVQLVTGKEVSDRNGYWLNTSVGKGLKHTDYLSSTPTEFVTDASGRIVFNCIINGTYHVYETGSINGYDIEAQTGYGADPAHPTWVDCGTVTVNGSTSTITVNDIKTRGNVKIIKKDSKNKDILLVGAKFKIQLVSSAYPAFTGLNGKWLSANAGKNYDYIDLHPTQHFVDSDASSGDFITDSKSEIYLKGLLGGTYHIWETETVEGYKIEEQEGYGKDGNHPTWVDCGTFTIDPYAEKNYTIENQRIVLSLSGNVWEDKTATPIKGHTDYNSLLDPNEVDKNEDGTSKIPEVTTVYLKDQSGNVMASTTVNKDTGSWEIKATDSSWATGKNPNTKINYWDLANAYVEFVYNNEKYVTVDTFKSKDNNVNKSLEVNSKAQEQTIEKKELNDRNLTGVTGAVPGLAVTKMNATVGMTAQAIVDRNYKNLKYTNEKDLEDALSTYGLTGYFNTEGYVRGGNITDPDYCTIKNINLGLWEKEVPSHEVVETLQYSKILMNGYTYTYDYANGQNQEKSELVPGTFKQMGATAYGAKIYPSDIAYTAAGSPNGTGMEMYVVYKIAITNKETWDYKNIYDEVKLNVTEISSMYNNTMYDICYDENVNRAGWRGSEYFGLWSRGTKTDGMYTGEAKYNVNGDAAIGKTGNESITDGIRPGETDSVYIQFKVKQQYLETVLKGNVPEQLQGAVTKVDTIGYHSYIRTDNVWDYGNSEKYYDVNDTALNQPAVDSNSYNTDKNETNINNSELLHRTDYEEGHSSALCLLFKIGETRTISGTVYEDMETAESNSVNESLGNGIIDDSETNRGQRVKVELLNGITGEKDMKLYKQQVGTETGYSVEEPETWTNESGEYTFEGMVPGLYKIRFTYADGTSKIIDGTEEGTNLTPRNYKSTIVNTTVAEKYIQAAMETEQGIMNSKLQELNKNISDGETLEKAGNVDLQKLVEWYKYLDGSKYNMATDDYDKRTELGFYSYDEDENITKDGAPATFEPMESYIPYFSISIENDKNVEGDTAEDYAHRPYYAGFNLGVIKVPRTDTKIEKTVSNMRLTLDIGTTLEQGDPSKTKEYIKALDKLTNLVGSQYARVELTSENLYGTELETTYEVKITNTSQKDYLQDEGPHYRYYFRYGDKTDAYLKKLTVETVLDEIDKDYDVEQSNLTTLKERVYHPAESRENANTNLEDTVTGTFTDIFATTGATSDINHITIEGWEGIEAGGTTITNYVAKSIFQEEMDLKFTNAVRITKIKLDAGATLQSSYEWRRKSSTTIAVMPDTGEDRSLRLPIIIAITLIITAAIVGTGAIVLKKKMQK